MGTTTFNASNGSSSTATGLVATLAIGVSNAYAFTVSQLSAWMRPQSESPAESAARLRTMAELYTDQQPSYAADLRAVADRYDAGQRA